MNKLIYHLLLIGVFLSPYIMYLPLGINFTVYDFILILCLGLIVISLTLQFDGKIKLSNPKEYSLIFLFIIGSSISALNAINVVSSMNILLQYLFAIIVQFVVINHLFRYSKDINRTIFKVLDVYIFSLLVVLFIGFAASTGLLPNGDIYFSGNGRLESVMGNPNVLAKYLVFSLPILLFYIDLKRKTFLSYFLIAILIYNLFLTASFGGFLYAVITTIYYYTAKMLFVSKPIKFNNGDILISKKIINIRIIMLLVFSIFSVTYILSNPPEVFSERILTANNLSEAGSANLKLDLMVESTKLISTEYGAVGMGLGSYPYISEYHTNVHNLYLLVFSETGILGFVGLFGLLFYTFILSLKLIRHSDPKTKYILLGLNSSVFGFLISITTSTHQYSRATWLIVILLLCFTKAIKQKQVFEKSKIQH